MSVTSLPRHVVGIMTGTSLDGIDVAVCTIEDGSPERIVLDAFSTSPYPSDLRERIRSAIEEPMSAADVLRLDMALAHAYADAVRLVADNRRVDLIGMHGQTLWHEPPTGTWQAGSATALAALLNVAVVADMRTTDVVLGGQGAPLVPLFDHAVLSDATTYVAALNIGGIANVTALPPSASVDDIRAFDTGPGNMLINAATQMLFGKQFDDHGSIARAGRVIPALLQELLAHPYMAQQPPKSTGRETFGDGTMRELIRRFGHGSIPSEDVVATITEFTARSIALHIQTWLPDAQRVVVSGGGVHNTWLMERLGALLSPRVVLRSDDVGVPADAKEAMCWAYLAWRTAAGLHGNVPSVTGASRRAVLGTIAMPPDGMSIHR
ncbi:MAG: anhydro-N-acetylmuramic acid kinase [Candidatus Kapabacteria bacterium]|nr:anhydro-N-acetylmuramic acid kinase [Candidatus Kapabacteria bacterium]